MKTIILIITAVTISLSSIAQHDYSIKPLPKIDFNSGVLQADSLCLNFDNQNKSPQYLALLFPKIESKKPINTGSYASKMPVFKPRLKCWNMPVVVPDSTVNYAIRQKQILSPDELRFKGRE